MKSFNDFLAESDNDRMNANAEEASKNAKTATHHATKDPSKHYQAYMVHTDAKHLWGLAGDEKKSSEHEQQAEFHFKNWQNK